MRRAEIGHYHHVAGPYLLRFAQEASWREDNRRLEWRTGEPHRRARDDVPAIGELFRATPKGDFYFL